MSTMTSADFGAEMVMGSVVVWNFTVVVVTGMGVVGVGGWVRSKPLVESYSQKLVEVGFPIMPLR